MGPIRGPYSLYPRHVRALMLPKKETKYTYEAFQMKRKVTILFLWNMISPVIFARALTIFVGPTLVTGLTLARVL